MGTQPQLFSLSPLPPLTPEDINGNPFAFVIPEDVLQLQADTLNVLEGRVDINTFDVDYQKKMKNYYRFSAIIQNSKSHNIAMRTPDTLDIVL